MGCNGYGILRGLPLSTERGGQFARRTDFRRPGLPAQTLRHGAEEDVIEEDVIVIEWSQA
ncbi:MAG: hypothetical protein V7647_2874 [Acidobacteriota bacterium]|jgi:hypothetical protein